MVSQISTQHVIIISVILLLLIVTNQLFCFIDTISLHQEYDDVVIVILKFCRKKDFIIEKQALKMIVGEEIAELLTLGEQTKEAEQILQVYSADIGWSVQLFLLQFLHHLSLAPIQHLPYVFRDLHQHAIKGEDE